MQGWTYLAIAVAVVFAISWYLTYTAARLDRLHARVEGSLAALDAQLVRRAETALELGHAQVLDPASSMLLASTAGASLEQADGALITEDVQTDGISPERSQAESDLTAALDAVLEGYVLRIGAADCTRTHSDQVHTDHDRGSSAEGADLGRVTSDTGLPSANDFGQQDDPVDGQRGDEIDTTMIRRLRDACDRVELARRFHNEAVLDVRRVRAKPVVRAFRLAGHTALPNTVDFDSDVRALGR